jgi:hypothetical protein
MIPVSRPRQGGRRQQAECDTYGEDRTKISKSPCMLLTRGLTRPPAASLITGGSGGSSKVSCCSPTQVHSMRFLISTNRGIKGLRPKYPSVMCNLRGFGSLLWTTCHWLRVVHRCCRPQLVRVGLQHNDAESVAHPSEWRWQGYCTAAKAHTGTSHGCHPGCPQLIRCT